MEKKSFKVTIGADHAGFHLKQEIIKLLSELGYQVLDRGCDSTERVDYPDFASLVATDVQKNQAQFGILVCGTGVGMAVTANKFKGIRAANLVDQYSAIMARKHNDLNMLCLGGRVLGVGTAMLLVETFLTTEFEGDRHQQRLNKIGEIEKSNC